MVNHQLMRIASMNKFEDFEEELLLTVTHKDITSKLGYGDKYFSYSYA